MKLKQLIQKLQEIDSKYGRDLDVFTVAEPGIVQILNVAETEIVESEGELITLEEDQEITVNSVFLEWN